MPDITALLANFLANVKALLDSKNKNFFALRADSS